MLIAQQLLPHTNWEFYGLFVLMLAQTIPAILAYAQSLANHRQGRRNSQDIQEVATQVNGKVEKLLTVSKLADQAEGRLQERHHHEELSLRATMSGKALLDEAEAKALSLLEIAAARARELLDYPLHPPAPPSPATGEHVTP